jgi:hypothetical protein
LEPENLLLCDKHKHKLIYTDLHPLVRIVFEGIATWRPYNAELCLTKEYGSQAIRDTSYRGYNYNAVNATWIGNGPLLPEQRKTFHTFRSAARGNAAVRTGRISSTNRIADSRIFVRPS